MSKCRLLLYIGQDAQHAWQQPCRKRVTHFATSNSIPKLAVEICMHGSTVHARVGRSIPLKSSEVVLH